MSPQRINPILFKISRFFYAAAMAGLGIQQFAYADFRPVILPLSPAWMHATGGYITGAVLVIAGAYILLSKKARIASLLVAVFLFILFIVFQCSYVLFIQPNSAYHLGLWTDPLKELALSGGAFVMAGISANETNLIEDNRFIKQLEKLIPFGKVFFSITMVAFGIDHFYYRDFVATLVPAWISGHIFWTYFAGAALTLGQA